jgi:hypothetical protein
MSQRFVGAHAVVTLPPPANETAHAVLLGLASGPLAQAPASIKLAADQLAEGCVVAWRRLQQQLGGSGAAYRFSLHDLAGVRCNILLRIRKPHNRIMDNFVLWLFGFPNSCSVRLNPAHCFFKGVEVQAPGESVLL